MARYKVNIVWEAEIEMYLYEDNPQGDYQSYSWDELFSRMKNAGISENVNIIRMED